jgi:hypothetical protein
MASRPQRFLGPPRNIQLFGNNVYSLCLSLYFLHFRRSCFPLLALYSMSFFKSSSTGTGRMIKGMIKLNSVAYRYKTELSKQCCGSETFHYRTGSDFSMNSGSVSCFQKVPVSDPTFFLKKYDFKGSKMAFQNIIL